MYQDLFLLQNICRFISVLQALEPDPYWNPLGTFVEPLLLLGGIQKQHGQPRGEGVSEISTLLHKSSKVKLSTRGGGSKKSKNLHVVFERPPTKV